jgi:predicted DNA-binding protein
MADDIKVRFLFEVPQELKERAEAAAEKEGGRSLSSYIRQALEERIERQEAAA